MKQEQVKYFCDMCGEEVGEYDIKAIRTSINTNQAFYIELCEKCFLENIIPPIKRLAEVRKQKFKFVGNCEQGGYSCPVCNECNNMYSFDGVCGKCGYEEKGFDRFERH